VVARYEAMGTSIWRTDRDGAVRITAGEQGLAVSGWRHEHRRYWHGQ